MLLKLTMPKGLDPPTVGTAVAVPVNGGQGWWEIGEVVTTELRAGGVEVYVRPNDQEVAGLELIDDD